jgi:hypothetical protein
MGWPTKEQLVVLIIAFCPNLDDHPKANKIVAPSSIRLRLSPGWPPRTPPDQIAACRDRVVTELPVAVLVRTLDVIRKVCVDGTPRVRA